MTTAVQQSADRSQPATPSPVPPILTHSIFIPSAFSLLVSVTTAPSAALVPRLTPATVSRGLSHLYLRNSLSHAFEPAICSLDKRENRPLVLKRKPSAASPTRSSSNRFGEATSFPPTNRTGRCGPQWCSKWPQIGSARARRPRTRPKASPDRPRLHQQEVYQQPTLDTQTLSQHITHLFQDTIIQTLKTFTTLSRRCGSRRTSFAILTACRPSLPPRHTTIMDCPHNRLLTEDTQGFQNTIKAKFRHRKATRTELPQGRVVPKSKSHPRRRAQRPMRPTTKSLET